MFQDFWIKPRLIILTMLSRQRRERRKYKHYKVFILIRAVLDYKTLLLKVAL